MYDYTNNNWSQWNTNEKLKEKFRNCTRETLDRFTTKDSYIWNITHNTESTAVSNLKPERWDHRWFKRNTGEKRYVTRNIHIMIMITIIISEEEEEETVKNEVNNGDVIFSTFLYKKSYI
jgi:hypothetical protein